MIVRQDSMPPHDISERQEVLNNAAASLAGKDDPILRARRALSERLTNQSATFLKKNNSGINQPASIIRIPVSTKYSFSL